MIATLFLVRWQLLHPVSLNHYFRVLYCPWLNFHLLFFVQRLYLNRGAHNGLRHRDILVCDYVEVGADEVGVRLYF